MKGRVIALGQMRGQAAAALVLDGVLQDLLIDAGDATPCIGALYRATVDRQLKGQGGVFVRLPGGIAGFLREVGGLRPGQTVIVQVAGHAEPGKAVPVTLRLLIKGRHAIITPGAPGHNMSRAIRDADIRDRLAAMAAATMAGRAASLGVILRSAAADADAADVASEIASLADAAALVMADIAGPPELLLDAPTAEEIAWRDWADPAPDEVATGPTAFADHGIDALADALLTPVVALGPGGTMVIEPTRALVAVDVNTGADHSPAAGLKANIAAARDLPRQLRLRGLGGQITVDFAPMPKKDRHILEQVLRGAFKADATETSLAGWTPLGMYELQRKRDRRPLTELLAAIPPPSDALAARPQRSQTQRSQTQRSQPQRSQTQTLEPQMLEPQTLESRGSRAKATATQVQDPQTSGLPGSDTSTPAPSSGLPSVPVSG